MAATANLKSTISLDATAFSAGARKVRMSAANTAKAVRASFRKIGGTIATIGKKLARFAAIASTITFAAAIAGAYKLGTALKKAFDTGGALSDLSAQTGIAVKELAILQQAFEDNGVSGDQVGGVINKLQRSISDFGAGLSTQVRAFEKLGISYDDIASKSPMEQFQSVQRAIAGMEDPTQRAATAMEIFGRSGGQMLTLFKDGGAIEKASITMGSQAELLDKNANTFDRISDLLNSAGKKIQGFIVGVADVAAPQILSALEKFNALDFAGMGQRFAKGLNLENITNVISEIAVYSTQILSEAIVKAFEIGYQFFNALFSPEGLSFLQHTLGNILFSAFEAAASFLAKALESVIKFLRNNVKIEDGMIKVDSAAKQTGEKSAQGFIDKLKDEMKTVDLGFSDQSKKAAENIKNAFAKLFPKLDSEADEYEKERQKQKEFVKNAEAMEAGQKSQEAAANQVHISPHIALKKNPALMGAFDKLQAEKASGIGVGMATSFAKDRERLGIASGLSSGGLSSGGIGDVRAVGKKAGAAIAKKEDTLVTTNQKLQEQIEQQKEQIDLLREGLSN